MVLKIVAIVGSLSAIALAAIIVGGVVTVGQALENGPKIHNEVRQWLQTKGSEHDLQENPLPSSASSSTSSPTPDEGRIVSIVANSRSNSYAPNPIEIIVGDTVTWINDDSSPHTVTSSNGRGAFGSDIMMNKETFTFTFDNEGEFPYFCTLHPSMIGKGLVTAS